MGWNGTNSPGKSNVSTEEAALGDESWGTKGNDSLTETEFGFDIQHSQPILRLARPKSVDILNPVQILSK